MWRDLIKVHQELQYAQADAKYQQEPQLSLKLICCLSAAGRIRLHSCKLY